MDKETMIKSGKIKLFTQYVNQNETVYEVKLFISIRNKNNRKSQSKRIVTFNKTQQ
jgi:hypothetical protein